LLTLDCRVHMERLVVLLGVDVEPVDTHDDPVACLCLLRDLVRERSISAFWKPASIPATAPPSSSTRAISAPAASSMSLVIDSIA